MAIIVSLVMLGAQVANLPVHLLGRKPDTNTFRPRTFVHPERDFSGLAHLEAGGTAFSGLNLEQAVAQYQAFSTEAAAR